VADIIAIVAALPREIAGLVRGVKPDATLTARGIYLYRLPWAVVVAAGMGSARAALAVEAALAAGDVKMLISTGLAGGCVPDVTPGAVLDADIVVDVNTGERFTSASQPVPPSRSITLATTDSIASVREKSRLAATYGALMVDMEAATVARLAAAHGLPFRAIKGISDAFDFELDSLGQFAGEKGSFRTAAFALHTALRPWTWGEAITLGRGSAKALGALDVVLKKVVGGAA
jgi:adenosylhomocysteine nucleosidase